MGRMRSEGVMVEEEAAEEAEEEAEEGTKSSFGWDGLEDTSAKGCYDWVWFMFCRCHGE